MSYGGHEAKFYYKGEETYGVTPAAPAMLGIENVESVEPSIDPGNIKIRGIGSRDLTQIKRGLRKVGLKLVYVVPSEDVLNFMAYVLHLSPYTAEVFYDKDGGIVDLRLTGCRSDSLTVECSVEDVVRATKEIIAQNFDAEVAKITGAEYADFEGAIPFDLANVEKGEADGSNLVDLDLVTDWKFNIANNLKRVPVLRANPVSLLTGNAASGQKVVAVVAGSKFKVSNQVKIEDDVNSELNVIDSIASNNLTMLNNLANTYTTAGHAQTTALVANLLKYLQERNRVLTGELVLDFENRTQYYEAINDSEFSLKFNMGAKYALFKYCKWDSMGSPTKLEDLVSLKAPFTAREVEFAT